MHMTSRKLEKLPSHMFSNPFWYALKTEHAKFAEGSGLALRYPPEVIPFCGLADTCAEAMAALYDLLAPGESIYVTAKRSIWINDLVQVSELQGWQMHLPAQTATALPTEPFVAAQVRALSVADVPAMMALTAVAFPGFFRPRSYELGSYCGIEVDGVLVAMAGERLALPGFREISGVCTHPDHTGRGYAALMMQYVMRAHRAAGTGTFLHVGAANERAISLYERLGFEKTRPIVFHQLRRR